MASHLWLSPILALPTGVRPHVVPVMLGLLLLQLL